MNDEKPSLDIFGIKPIGDAVLVVTKASVEGAGAILSRICLPAAQEFGFLLQDKVHAWRQANAVAILNETQRKLEANAVPSDAHAHPRIVAAALEHGSWSDDRSIQEMWAGLLASSCVPNGLDDSNLVFTGILAQLTALQAAVVKYSCETTPVAKSVAGLIIPQGVGAPRVSSATLKSICACDDLYRIDFELDRLRDLGLISQGFTPHGDVADITATSFALNMYVRCQGYSGSPIHFFKIDNDAGKQSDIVPSVV